MKFLNKVKKIHLCGYNLPLHDESEFQDFIRAQCIPEKEVKYCQYLVGGIELKFSDGKLSGAYELDEGYKGQLELTEASKSFSYFEAEPHPIHFFVPSKRPEKSYLGGRPGNNQFKIPIVEDIKAPFQFIGCLSPEEPGLSWLGMGQFNIVYPLFADITDEKWYFDYSDENHPRVLNKLEAGKISYPYGTFSPKLIHEFEPAPIRLMPITSVREKDFLSFDFWHHGNLGVPVWVQHPEYPRCPISGRPMRFVCQIDPGDTQKIMASRSELCPEKESHLEYMNNLRFWGSGTLYIFMEPETRTVCMFIQDT